MDLCSIVVPNAGQVIYRTIHPSRIVQSVLPEFLTDTLVLAQVSLLLHLSHQIRQ